MEVAEYASTAEADAGTDPTQVVHHVYDVNDHWIGRQVDADADGALDQTDRFLYDGEQMVLRFSDADATADQAADLILWLPPRTSRGPTHKTLLLSSFCTAYRDTQPLGIAAG